ncbi:type II toxin-antitoxin system RelE/ParE family toxin [Acidobacteriota bacterium]
MLLPTAQKDFDQFQGRIFNQIRDKIFSLRENPRPLGCLKLTAENEYRLRSGDYRILYRIDDKIKRIFVYRVRHRKEVYK